MITLQAFGQYVGVDSGELISYRKEGHEYIHQKGSPGWRSSDTEMFPIIGPTQEAAFRVKTPKGTAVQDQHGLLRELEYRLVDSSSTMAVFEKEYSAGTAVKNSKYPEKSSEATLEWPYDFRFRKHFVLGEKGLEIHFEIEAKEEMPFMLGYHPAFKLYTEKPLVLANDKEISLASVLAVGNRAFQLAHCTSIGLKDKKELQIVTEGFGHFMLWTEVPNMICIEPITFYPYAVSQQDLHQGFQHTGEILKTFKVCLFP
ncbi:aldose epimerase family protein [Spongiimicrobium salis]|uniref:aldose epimerase family protein n=1 Tax=Spongiimicrobium salis TaxID=1667022 RepID=UPI00374D45D9